MTPPKMKTIIDNEFLTVIIQLKIPIESSWVKSAQSSNSMLINKAQPNWYSKMMMNELDDYANQ